MKGILFLAWRYVVYHKIKTAILNAPGLSIELISPLPGEEVLRRFLDTRGEGFYRLAFRTDNCDEALAHFDQNDVRYVDLSADGGQRVVFTAEAVNDQRLRDVVMVHLGQKVVRGVEPARLQLAVPSHGAEGVEEPPALHARMPSRLAHGSQRAARSSCVQ